MRYLLPLFSGIVLTILFLFSCIDSHTAVSRARTLEEIESVIDSGIGWFRTKDFDLMYSVYARDADYLEVHPDSTVVRGHDEFKKRSDIFRNPEFLYLRHEISDLKITLSKKGDTAWFFCMLDDISTWKGREVGWKDTRWTGTLENRAGCWVIVQQHFSFAAD